MNIAGNPAGRKEKGSLTQAVVIKSKSCIKSGRYISGIT